MKRLQWQGTIAPIFVVRINTHTRAVWNIWNKLQIVADATYDLHLRLLT